MDILNHEDVLNEWLSHECPSTVYGDFRLFMIDVHCAGTFCVIASDIPNSWDEETKRAKFEILSTFWRKEDNSNQQEFLVWEHKMFYGHDGGPSRECWKNGRHV